MIKTERKSWPKKNQTPAVEAPQEALPLALTTDTLNDTQTSQESDMDTLSLDTADQTVTSDAAQADITSLPDARPATINRSDVHGVSISPMQSGKHTAYAIIVLAAAGTAANLNGSTNDLWLNSASYTLENGISFEMITFRKVIYSAEKAMKAVSDLIPGFYPDSEVACDDGTPTAPKAVLSNEDAALASAVVKLIKLGKSEEDARNRVGYTGPLPRYRLPKAPEVAVVAQAEASEQAAGEVIEQVSEQNDI